MAEAEDPKNGPPGLILICSQVLSIINRTRESLGISGLVAAAYLFFMWVWGTPDQKHEFIQKVLLGHMFEGMGSRGLILSILGLAALALYLMSKNHNSVLNLKDQEIARLNERLRNLDEKERALGKQSYQPKLDLDSGK